MEIEDSGGDELCINWKVKNNKGDVVSSMSGNLLQHSFCFQLSNVQ